MKNMTILLLLSAVISLQASDRKAEAEKKKQAAARAIIAQLVTPITPPLSTRALLSRALPTPAMYYDTEVLEENSEVPGEFAFRVRERHRVAGKKPHPRDGLIVHRGYYEAHTVKVYVLNRKTSKFVTASRHPQVIEGAKRRQRNTQSRLQGIKLPGSK